MCVYKLILKKKNTRDAYIKNYKQKRKKKTKGVLEGEKWGEGGGGGLEILIKRKEPLKISICMR